MTAAKSVYIISPSIKLQNSNVVYYWSRSPPSAAAVILQNNNYDIITCTCMCKCETVAKIVIVCFLSFLTKINYQTI